MYPATRAALSAPPFCLRRGAHSRGARCISVLPTTLSHPTLKILGFRDPKILLNLGGNQTSKPRRGPASQSRRVSQGAEDLGLRCPPATAQIGQRPPRAPIPISTPGYKLLGENFGSGLGFGLPSQHGVQFRLPYIEISVRVSASASHANLM